MADGADAPPSDPRLLLVLAHPTYERSRANSALAAAAEGVAGVTLHDLYEAYPDFMIDVKREQKRLLEHAVIALQFPLYWYSTPALLKEWLDHVWLHGFAYGRDGTSLRGKTLHCAVTTGGVAADYGAGGANRFSIAEFLRPLEQTAHLCGMRWAEPFVVHGAAVLDEPARAAEAERYRRRLGELVAEAVSGMGAGAGG